MDEIAQPIKSENDRRSYRAVKLKNGLRALLISDSEPIVDPNEEEDLERGSSDSGHISENEALDSGKESSRDEDSEVEDEDVADEDEDEDSGDDDCCDAEPPRAVPKEKMAAAALCVGVGSFCDPDDLPGMAHFLEHMLFMGSEKYPDENDFDAFVQKHGGSDNAFTDCERTVYYLEISTKHFKDGLDRFAQFFIAPLMKPDSTDRELEAIESEFSLRMPSDSVRCEQLLGTLSKPNSPLGKFFWGNTQSLKTTPEENGIDVHSRLKEFYKRHYSSHYMTLVVLSRETLDTLENWVTEIFSSVPNNGLPPPSLIEPEQPFCTPQFTKLYKVSPVKQTHEVTIHWSLPSMSKFYKVKPLGYLGWLVGHEGKGSLLQYLKKNVWALNLCAGNSETNWDQNCFNSLFCVSVTLTESGMENVEEVLKCVFQYLALLKSKGPQANIYKEIKLLDKNAFKWKDEVEPQNYVETLSQNMQLYEPEDVIRGDQLMMEYDESLIAQCLDYLRPENCNVMILSNRYKLNDPCNQTEKWMKTPFCKEDIPEQWISTWKNPPLNPELFLPPENPFIATDFDIKMAHEEYNTEFPVKLFEDSKSRLWFKKDNKFNVPKGYVYLQLSPPFGKCTAQDAVLLELFIEHIDHNLNSEAYAAKMASSFYAIYLEDTGVVIKLFGFNHKLSVLLSTILDHFSNFKVDSGLFESLKMQLRKSYYNRFIKPGNLCSDLRLSCLEELCFTPLEKHSRLNEITEEQLSSFAKRFVDSLFVEGLVHGNFTPEEALEFNSMVKDKLNFSALPPELIPEPRTMEISNSNILQVLSFNTQDRNSAVTNYYQLGPGTIYTCCLLDLLMEMMEEPCFDQLRTREQLGYSVNCSSSSIFGILGFTVTVHSSADKYCCSHLNGRIEAFLKDFKAHLMQLSEEDFKTHITTLVKLKNCAALHMHEDAYRHWSEIINKTYIFDRLKKETEALKRLTLDEFKIWACKAVSLGAENKSKLSFQVVGPGIVALAECLEKSSKHCIDNNENAPEDMETEMETECYRLQLQLPKRKPDDSRFIKDIALFKEKLPVFPVCKIVS